MTTNATDTTTPTPGTEEPTAEAPATDAPAAEADKPKVVFIKIDRPLFDKVQAYASKGFLENKLPNMTDKQIEAMDAWVRELRAQKRVDTFLSMPVSTPQQTNAGRMYLQSLARIQGKIREVRGARMADAQFALPVPA